MPTIKQRKAANKVVDLIKNGEDMTGAQILDFIGYSKAIQKNPKMVFDSDGFKEAMAVLGFSIEAADMAIAKILRTGKEENRIRASQEVYKRLGAYTQPDTGNKTLIINITGETANRYGVTPRTETSSN